MIKSMTGYGRGRYDNNGKEINVEIKSVNHKYHDISVKMPKNISYLEEFVKKRINETVSRGKIDVFINITNYENKEKIIKVDEELANNYLTVLTKLSEKMKLNDKISVIDIVRFPDVLTIIDNQDEENAKKELSIALEEAINNFVDMRKAEGIKISEDLQNRIEQIFNNLKKISELSTGLIDEYIVKLNSRIKELINENIIDENRLAMEAVLYADKTSIQEELTRLDSHISQFGLMLKEDKPCGKKLDFIIQEMNRETNTIASKANCLGITKLVIDIKNELENIREQVQNIE